MRYCQVTGKSPLVGCNVSHSNRHTKRRFEVNLKTKRFWLEDEKRWITIRVSTRGMRVIDLSDPNVETSDQVAARIRAALKYLRPERLVHRNSTYSSPMTNAGAPATACRWPLRDPPGTATSNCAAGAPFHISVISRR